MGRPRKSKGAASRERLERRWSDAQLHYAKQLRSNVHGAPFYRQHFAHDRPAYEAFLADRYGEGISSSTQLTIDQLQDLNKFLRGHGPQNYRPRNPPGRRTGSRAEAKVEAPATEAQREKISRLGSMVRWDAANGFELWMEKRGGWPKTDKAAFLLIEALKGMFERQMEQTYGPDWMARDDLPFQARRYVQLHY